MQNNRYNDDQFYDYDNNEFEEFEDFYSDSSHAANQGGGEIYSLLTTRPSEMMTEAGK